MMLLPTDNPDCSRCPHTLRPRVYEWKDVSDVRYEYECVFSAKHKITGFIYVCSSTYGGGLSYYTNFNDKQIGIFPTLAEAKTACETRLELLTKTRQKRKK